MESGEVWERWYEVMLWRSYCERQMNENDLALTQYSAWTHEENGKGSELYISHCQNVYVGREKVKRKQDYNIQVCKMIWECRYLPNFFRYSSYEIN